MTTLPLESTMDPPQGNTSVRCISEMYCAPRASSATVEYLNVLFAAPAFGHAEGSSSALVYLFEQRCSIPGWVSRVLSHRPMHTGVSAEARCHPVDSCPVQVRSPLHPAVLVLKAPAMLDPGTFGAVLPRHIGVTKFSPRLPKYVPRNPMSTSPGLHWYIAPLRYIRKIRAKIRRNSEDTIRRPTRSPIDRKRVLTTTLRPLFLEMTRSGRKVRRMRSTRRKPGPPPGLAMSMMETNTTMPSSQFQPLLR
mmetsp:Transcript_55141/g.124135  ORF Transcript_55141/g.124135 Transcript_55141/m.124135 type:complete len:250 (-) Transcript_55141:2942-3691(-)